MWINGIEKLKVFLRRAAKFPSSKFLVLNVQELPSEHQELIVDFLSRPESIKSYNMNCVQLSETILHASPWVENIIWENNKIHETLKSSKEKVQEWLKGHVSTNNVFERITVVASLDCGTGKTRYIDQELTRISQHDHCTQVGRISVHEGTTLKGLIRDLVEKFTDSRPSNALYFALMVPLGSKHSELMSMLNYFFQSLLLTRSVYDHNNKNAFNIDSGKWTIFIEIVGNGCRDCTDVMDLLHQYIPILAYCCTFATPAEKFQVDEKTRRVCTYLRAFHDGTINRKFQVQRKQLMFVIDKSGSMSQMIKDGKNALDVAVDNAIEIFNSHVQIDDVSASSSFTPCILHLSF